MYARGAREGGKRRREINDQSQKLRTYKNLYSKKKKCIRDIWGERERRKRARRFFLFYFPSSDEGKCHPRWCVRVEELKVYGKKRPVRSLVRLRGRERGTHNSMRRYLYISLVTLLAPTGSSYSPSSVVCNLCYGASSYSSHLNKKKFFFR